MPRHQFGKPALAEKGIRIFVQKSGRLAPVVIEQAGSENEIGIKPQKGAVRFMNVTVPFLRVKKQPQAIDLCYDGGRKEGKKP